MGTHPIFESDFDCLTALSKNRCISESETYKRMGGHLPKPITTKEQTSGQGNGLTWHCRAMQGWRMDMEDAHITKAVLSDRLSAYSLFAVFDGHAGKEVANLTALEFTDHLLSIAPFDKLDDDYRRQDVIDGLRQAFQTWDVKLRSHPHLTKIKDRSGATATGVLITPKNYFVFNVGDSRTILVRDSKLHFSSMDHKPMGEIEKKRIQQAGGKIIINRINGSLAVSRALGDFDYKNDIVNYVNERFASEEHERDIVSHLLDLALHKNSKDNMSACVISLDKGKIAQDAELVSRDKAYTEQLKSFITDYVTRRRAASVLGIVPKSDVFEAIQAESSLTPTSVMGFVAKQGVIERHYESLIDPMTPT